MTPVYPSVVESRLSTFPLQGPSGFNPIYLPRRRASCFDVPLPTDGHGFTSGHVVGPCWGP
eukprot:2528957-Pyramimonas_sp.AAC.1